MINIRTMMLKSSSKLNFELKLYINNEDFSVPHDSSRTPQGLHEDSSELFLQILAGHHPK
jgi:hypothetical protein